MKHPHFSKLLCAEYSHAGKSFNGLTAAWFQLGSCHNNGLTNGPPPVRDQIYIVLFYELMLLIIHTSIIS